MMRWVVGSSLRFRSLVLGVAAAVLILGISQLQAMPRDMVPEFAPPYVEVQTEALGLSAEEVEQLITVPMEADLLHGVAWLREIRSNSVPGLSSIVLEFEPGTDPIRARQMVAERLTQAHALPNVSRPPVMLQPLSSTSRVMMIGLSSKDVSLIDMSVLAQWIVKPRLLGVPGVANVSIWGQRERQLQVLVDPGLMRKEQVTLQQVIETAGNSLWVSPLTFLDASTPGTGGFIDTPNQRLGIQHIQAIRTATDLAQVPIDDAKGVVLGDIAKVVEDHQPLIGDAVVKDGAGLLLVIEKFPDANTLQVTSGLEAAIAALRPGLTGIEVDPTVYRPASFIESATDNLLIALILGLFLAALALWALLDWRAALVGFVTIPLSLAAAGLVLYLLHATVNAMIVAGLVLAIGIIVDDVVIGTDNVVRRFREKRAEDQERSAAAVVMEASLEGRSAIVYATLIVVLAVAPVAFIGGSVGAFLPPLALAYVLAVLASLVVALTVTPALSSLLIIRRPGERRETRIAARIKVAYARVLAQIVGRARPAFAAVAVVTLGALLLVGLTAAPHLGQSLLPAFQERDLLIRWDGTPSASRSEMDRIMARASAELRTIPGIRNVGAHVGRAITSDKVVNMNAAEVWISIDPAAKYQATLAAVQELVDGYPGLGRAVTTYSSERIGEVLSDSDDDFVVRVYGQDQSILQAKADEIRQALTEIPGVVDPTVAVETDQPTFEVQVDLAAAERHGIKPGDVRRATTTLLSGIHVGSLFEDQKVFEVVVWGGPEMRHSLSSIQDLMIDTPSGVPVRLTDVASVRVASTPSVIRREGVMRILDVGARVADRDFGAVMADVDKRLAAIPFALEYHAEVRGVSAERQAALLRLLTVIVVAAIGIFLLLQASFGSWRLAFMTLLILPAALVGGLLAGLATDGGVLSLGALVGLFTVLAIAARNAILLIVHYQHLERSEGESPGLSLVLRGARDRLTPIMTTAVATAAAVAPFVLLGDLPGYEIVRPMAAVILGGLVTSTLMSLFIVPTVYLRAGPSPEAEPLTQPVDVTDQSVLSPA
jgi:Cu/Ag efflux pump CusA